MGGNGHVAPGSLPTLDDALATLEQRKRAVYLGGGLAAVLVIAASWLTRVPGDPMVEVGYPILGLALASLVFAAHRRWVPLVVAETTFYASLSIIIGARLVWHLFLAGPIGDHLLVLAGGHYWSVAALIIAGFVVYGLKAGIWAGSTVILTSAVLVAVGAGNELIGPDGDRVAVLYLVRVHAFLVIVLALTASVAAMREHLHRTLAHAEMLAQLAMTDHLTGLANRRAATDLLHDLIDDRTNAIDPQSLSVIAIDLDRFKRINDTYGHDRGDRVLQEVAAVLAAHAREHDVVARWGGEEFLIVAPDTDLAGATALAERCRLALGDTEPAGVQLTGTFGVAQWRQGNDLRGLLTHADAMMLEGKRAGRDRVVAASQAA